MKMFRMLLLKVCLFFFTKGDLETVLIREASLFQRLICTQCRELGVY